MDSLKSLFAKKEYQLIVDLTNNSTDEVGLIYRLSSLVSLNKKEEALDCILSHRELLIKNNLLSVMKLHFDLLFELNKFIDAYEEVVYYSNLPYESQEVEEYLRELPKLIRVRDKESTFSKDVSESEIKRIIENETVSYNVLLALDKVKDLDKEYFYPAIIKLLKDNNRNLHHYVKTFALLILVESNYDNEITFLSNKKEITLNPSKLSKPYVGKNYKDVVLKMNQITRNPSLSNAAINLLNDFILLRYPEDVLEDNANKMIAVFLTLACQLFADNKDIDSIYKQLGVNRREINLLCEQISNEMNNVEPLEI